MVMHERGSATCHLIGCRPFKRKRRSKKELEIKPSHGKTRA
jgi:hypothetical protein